ncbi:hypothetical protein BACIH_1848 [Bacillus amyloliquefaciens]|nr:hypothetical protein U471_18740 [Bacillus amyloliquefaciens CC178]KYC90846.1 hypothetical protein B4140_1705 [Bacillus amyloliquefaciens]RAP14703.1 hypothetical protein HS9_00026 [Bacillus velezensis]QEY91649.1 hypothetical protein BACIT_3890 [Bacillus amyloliquefaciens]QEY93588.1 hypothetical protein BACIH_1848 [Bacillus amyloliquefaciens]
MRLFINVAQEMDLDGENPQGRNTPQNMRMTLPGYRLTQ